MSPLRTALFLVVVGSLLSFIGWYLHRRLVLDTGLRLGRAHPGNDPATARGARRRLVPFLLVLPLFAVALSRALPLPLSSAVAPVAGWITWGWLGVISYAVTLLL